MQSVWESSHTRQSHDQNITFWCLGVWRSMRLFWDFSPRHRRRPCILGTCSGPQKHRNLPHLAAYWRIPRPPTWSENSTTEAVHDDSQVPPDDTCTAYSNFVKLYLQNKHFFTFCPRKNPWLEMSFSKRGSLEGTVLFWYSSSNAGWNIPADAYINRSACRIIDKNLSRQMMLQQHANCNDVMDYCVWCGIQTRLVS